MSKQKRKIIQLACKHDPKDPEHLQCTEAEPVLEHDVAVVDHAQENAQKKNILIGAINIGTEPVAKYWKERYDRFYHPKLGSRKHVFVDMAFAGAIVILIGLNIIFAMRLKNPVAAESFSVKFTASPETPIAGKEYTTTLTYVNDGRHPLDNAMITMSTSPWLKILRVDDQSWEVKTKTIKLPQLLPGGTEHVAITVIPERSGTHELVAMGSMLNKRQERVFQSTNLKIQVPDVALNTKAFARYFSPEGEQLGRGPLPPEVGKETKYHIVWLMPTGPYNFQDVVFEGTLSPQVSWTGFVPMGSSQISYDTLTRTIAWHVPNHANPQELSSNNRAVGVEFEISVKPEEWSRGLLLPLVTNIKTQGQEALTKTTVSSQLPDITTDLTTDQKAQGKGGKVQ